MLAGEGLHPSSKGVRVRFSGTSRVVTAGPFAETNELIAGSWLWNVASMEEVIAWVERCPNPMIEDSKVEFRPVFEADDLGDAFTPKLSEQEAAVRAKALRLSSPTFWDVPDPLVAGIGASYDGEDESGIPGQWERLAGRLKEVPGRVGGDSFGVCLGAGPGDRLDSLAGVTVSSADGLLADLSAQRLDARRYAIFAHGGHVSALPATIDAIRMRWAPDCGLRLAYDAPCVERYAPEIEPELGLGGVEIWIPPGA